MEQETFKFLERRRQKSLSLNSVIALVNDTKQIPRIIDPDNKKSPVKALAKIDVQNLLSIFDAFGKNDLPIGQGHYLHPIELAKAMGLFKEDSEDPHVDSGVRRIVSLIPNVNRQLFHRKEMLANLPAAGYRIASAQEGLLEVKKSLVRSFGNVLGALNRARYGIDKNELPFHERDRLEEIERFTNGIFIELKAEIGSEDDDDDPNSPISEVVDRPLI